MIWAEGTFLRTLAMDYNAPHPKETLTPDIIEAIQHLYYWQYSNTYSFTDILFILFQKADRDNREKLRRGFPSHFIAYQLWFHHPNQDEFFRYYGVVNPKSEVEKLNEKLQEDFTK